MSAVSSCQPKFGSAGKELTAMSQNYVGGLILATAALFVAFIVWKLGL